MENSAKSFVKIKVSKNLDAEELKIRPEAKSVHLPYFFVLTQLELFTFADTGLIVSANK